MGDPGPDTLAGCSRWGTSLAGRSKMVPGYHSTNGGMLRVFRCQHAQGRSSPYACLALEEENLRVRRLVSEVISQPALSWEPRIEENLGS